MLQVVLVIILVFFHPLSSNAGVFPEEMLNGWKKWEERFTDFRSFVSVSRIVVNEAGEKLKDEKFQYHLFNSGGNRKAEIHKRGIVIAISSNNKYGFLAEQREERWSMKDYRDPHDQALDAELMIGYQPLALVTGLEEPYSVLSDTGKFQFEKLDQDAKGYLGYQFKSAKSDPQITGKVYFDPKVEWGTRLLELMVKQGDRVIPSSYVIEFGVDQAGLFYPSRIHEKSGGLTVDHSVKEWEYTAVPSSEFKLTHYGLPEREVELEAGNSYWWLWGVLGIFCILIRVVMSRTRKSPSPLPESG